MQRLKKNKPLLVTTLLLLICTVMQSKSIASQPHTHGQADLTIIIENEIVNIQLIAPAESLVGFEHSANTEKELRLLSKIKKRLSFPEKVIHLQGGGCLINEINIDTSDLTPDTHKPYDNSSALSKKTKRRSDHAEITAQYIFHCKEVSQLTSASVDLFQNFNGIAHINAMWVSTKEQASRSLSRANKHIQLR